LPVDGPEGAIKEPRKDGRWNAGSSLLELKRGLMASMIIRRPVDVD
jgi:hypothetical protein